MFVLLSLICVFGIYLSYKDYFITFFGKRWLPDIFLKVRKNLEFWIMKKNKNLVDKELFNSSVILKNLSLVNRQTPFSADYMYEKLMENSVILKPVYRQMLTLYRSRNNSEAFKTLSLTLETKNSKQFSVILSKLEKLNPSELEKQMEVFQKSMMENRMTYAIKRVQRGSLILTALSTVTIFTLLLNFVVVVVFLSTIETLSQLFI